MGAYNFFGPDLRGPEFMAILGCIGATAGAVSAIIVYAICARKRRVLNWFERDLLDQSKEAEKSLKDDAIIQMGKNCDKDNQCGILASKIMKTHQLNHRQSECGDDECCAASAAVTSASTSLIAQAPLPTGDVVLVGSDNQRVVLVKGLSVSSRSSSYADSEDADADATLTSRGAGSSSSTESESCCSDDLSCPRSPLETCGRIDMHVAYDKVEDALRVKIFKVYDLIETANPYVKIRLIPDRTCVKKTKIIKQTLKPECSDYFIFQVPANRQLDDLTLEIVLYDHLSKQQKYLQQHKLGYLHLPLAQLMTELVDGDGDGEERNQSVISQFFMRCLPFEDAKSYGELMVSMTYQSQAERLTVVIIRARDLFFTPDEDEEVSKDGPTYEIYVQVNVLRDGKSFKRKKTGVRRCDHVNSPVWSETLNFDMTHELLATSTIDFSICRTPSQIMACCQVSAASHSNAQMFQNLLSGATSSAQWLPLNEPK